MVGEETLFVSHAPTAPTGRTADHPRSPTGHGPPTPGRTPDPDPFDPPERPTPPLPGDG